MSVNIRITKGKPKWMSPEMIAIKMTPRCVLREQPHDIVVFNHTKKAFYVQIYDDKDIKAIEKAKCKKG